MNEDKSDTHSGIVVAIIFSIAAIIMSICSLTRNNERVLGFDYLGVIVGILALLVTFLVGWQIYSLVRLEQIRLKYNKIQGIIDNAKDEIYNDLIGISAQSSFFFAAQFLNNYTIDRKDFPVIGMAYYMLAHATRGHILCGAEEYKDSCLRYLINCLSIADSNNAWDAIFDDSITSSVDAIYFTLLKSADKIAKRDLQIIEIIRYCRKNHLNVNQYLDNIKRSR